MVGILSATVLATACTPPSASKRALFDTTLAGPGVDELSLTTPSGAENLERPVVASAGRLLGPDRSGPGYEVADVVSSDGRYYRYAVSTSDGTYTIQGTALMKKHLQELKVTAALRKRSKALAFAGGSADAVLSPVTSVIRAVQKPGRAVESGYANVKAATGKLGRGAKSVSTFVTTGKMPSGLKVKREDDHPIGGIIGIAQARRDLAVKMKVDPYTHYRPLRRELDAYATAHGTGKLGVDVGLNFVTGAAGYVITGVGLVDTATKEIVNLEPKELAEINRKRLLEAGFEPASIDVFLVNNAYTPTEKALLIGKILKVRKIRGRNELLAYASNKDNRAEAFETIQSITLLVDSPSKSRGARRIAVLKGHPIIFSKRAVTVVAPYDKLSWTRANAAHFAALSREISARAVPGTSLRLVLSGSTTPLADSKLRQLGWQTKANSSMQ